MSIESAVMRRARPTEFIRGRRDGVPRRITRAPLILASDGITENTGHLPVYVHQPDGSRVRQVIHKDRIETGVAT